MLDFLIYYIILGFLDVKVFTIEIIIFIVLVYLCYKFYKEVKYEIFFEE